MPALRVLLVEDSPSDAKLVLHELRRAGDPVEHERVEDLVSLRAALARRPWDVVISDWTLPHFTGAEALKAVQATGQDLPFLIVTGTIGEENAAIAMREGAHDFILKDRLTRLVPAVARALSDRDVRASKRRAERALAESEARYRRILETTILGVWVLDREGRTSFLNGRMAQLLGYAVEEVMGRPVAEFLPESERRAAERRGAPRARGARSQTRLSLLRKDGSTIAVHVEATPVFDDAGTFDGTHHMVTDDTEQSRAQEALRLSEARFSRLAESGLVGIALADVYGRVHDANDAYLLMFGFTREDLAAGRVGWREATPPEWAEGDLAATAKLQETGVAPPWEKEMFRTDRTRIPVLVGVAMLDHPNCIAFAVDLTERKRAEAALRSAEAQLRQAQKLEAIGSLAGGIAHDFNNLLSVILGYSDMALQRLAAGDPLRHQLQQVQKAGQRATDLTRQLLAFSRRQVLQPRPVDLAAALAGMASMLRRLLGEDVELTILSGAGLRKVCVDPGQFDQVVLNLAVNARDAMPRGGKLTIETSNVVLDEPYASRHVGTTPGERVLLAVSDTGVGMDAATLARIFEPFFTTKEPGRGTGLGLSTVHGIVEQSGGSIWVYSEPDIGTTFKIYFAPVAGDVDTTDLAPPRAEQEHLEGTETILLAEDDEALRGLTLTILAQQGYHVLVAQSGGDALLLAEQHPGPIHLLLTDVVMPRMSGRQLAERLQILRPEMKVLYMSGYTDDAVVRHGVLNAEVAFLQKPILADQLVRKIRSVLGRGPRG